MPAGAARAESAVPDGFAGLGGFPKGEVAQLVFLVFILLDPCAGLDAGGVQFRKLAVFRKALNSEISRSLAFVSVSLLVEKADQLDHFADVLSSRSDPLRRFETKRGSVFLEGGSVLGRIFTDRLAGLDRVADDLVVHVGDVHDVVDLVAAAAQIASQNVLESEAAKIADVDVVIDRGTARIHAHLVFVERREGFEAVGKRIEEMQCHGDFGHGRPYPTLAGGYGGFTRQFVAAVVVGVVGVALDPAPLDLVTSSGFV